MVALRQTFLIFQESSVVCGSHPTSHRENEDHEALIPSRCNMSTDALIGSGTRPFHEQDDRAMGFLYLRKLFHELYFWLWRITEMGA
jgi:hypothetical protein